MGKLNLFWGSLSFLQGGSASDLDLKLQGPGLVSSWRRDSTNDYDALLQSLSIMAQYC